MPRRTLPLIHFLHIGKTGGSAIKAALRPHADAFRLVLHEHATKLRDVPSGERVVLFLRNPISRFTSGFYSRQRQGQPLYSSRWNRAERRAFKIFSTPNELAEALSAWNPLRRLAARTAMGGIQHVRTSFYDWLESDDYLGSRQQDILLIGFQETLADDHMRLVKMLGISSAPLPSGTAAHRNPNEVDTGLSSIGLANIQQWYRRDLKLYRRLLNERKRCRDI